jgi:hypothetical protein
MGEPLQSIWQYELKALQAIADAHASPPSAQQRVLGALAVAVEGDSAPAQAVLWLTWPVLVRPNSARLRGLAAQVLLAAARATLAQLRPEALDRISQALEQALEHWPPRLQPQDGGSHWRPE